MMVWQPPEGESLAPPATSFFSRLWPTASPPPPASAVYTPLLAPVQQLQLQPQLEEVPHYRRALLFTVFVFAVLAGLVALLAVIFVFLAYFNVFNILYALDLETSKSSAVVHSACTGESSNTLNIPTCTNAYFAVRLVYNPTTASLEDTSGLGCTVALGTTQINASGVDPVIGPFWSGCDVRAFDLPGCTSYTYTQWIQLQDAVMLSQRIMTIYSTLNPSTGPFPLSVFLAGCGIQVLGSHSYALPQNTWIHIGIVYDGIARTNTWYINGNQVFSWAAYTDPPPAPYLSGTMTLNTLAPLGTILLGEMHLYCGALTSSQLVADAALVTPTFPPLALAFPSTFVIPQQPLPQTLYQGSTDTNDLSAFFCVFPPADQSVPDTPSSNYTTFYIDQVYGSDTALGMGTDFSAWQTLTNTAIFGNIAYDFADGTLDSGVLLVGQSSSLTFNVPPTIAAGIGACKLWYFVNANTGDVSYTASGTEFTAIHNGIESGSSMDGSSSMWLRMVSVIGKVYIPPNGGYSQIATINTFLTPGAGGGGAGFTYTFGSSTNTLGTSLSYNTPYYVTQVWSCTLGYMQLFVNGEMVSNITSGIQVCPSIAPGAIVPFMSSDGSANTFTGYLGALSMHYIALPISAVQALYRIMLTPQSPCALANFCFALMICQSSRFFGVAQGVQIMSGAAYCDTVIGSYDCGYGTDQPLISGAVILPQTSTVGWQEVTYVNPSTGVSLDVLSYNLADLYEATGTQFLPNNPGKPFGRYPASSFPAVSTGVGTALPGYMPIVMNDLYTTPRAPNIDDPRYPLGNRFYHTLHSLSYLSDGKDLENAYPNAQFYSPAYYAANSHLQSTPGSWCNMTWNQMFFQNTAEYLSFMEVNTPALNEGAVWGFQFTYDNTAWTPPTFSDVGGGVINCQIWYETEITNGLPSAPGLNWTDPTLALYGLWPSHTGTPGYLIPQCFPACTRFTEYCDQIYPPTPNVPPPPFTQNPLAQATGGWQSQNSYYFQGDQFNTVFFDGPCEAFYDQITQCVYLIPCNAQHKAALLTASSIALDPIVIAQNPAATVNWARLVDRNTQLGVTVGYGGWVQSITRAGAIVQDIAISHFNGWGLAIYTNQPSLVQNVAMSYNLNHIRLVVQSGASFVFNSTLVNTTRAWYGISEDNDGYGIVCAQMGPLATCAAIDTDIITTIGATSVNFMRGVRFVDNAGQSAIATGNKLWIETSLFNITEVFVGDAGTIYNDPTPTTFLWVTFDNTVFAQSENLDLQQAFVFGAAKSGFPRAGGYWIGQSLVWHGCQFLNFVADVVGLYGATSLMSYNLDSFAQLTSILFTGGSFQFIIPGTGQTLPTTPLGAQGRPFGFNNCYAIFDDVQYNPIAVAYDYPLFGPGFQGQNPMWRWGTGVSTWVNNFQICYGQLDFNGSLTAPTIDAGNLALTAEYSGLSVPLHTTLAMASAIIDWDMAVQNDAPLPQFGLSTCHTMRDTVKQQLANEAAWHTEATQAALMAILQSQHPFYIPALATQLTEASEWEEPMSRYNPSGPLWPPEQGSTFCSSLTTCAPYLLTQLTPVLATSTWTATGGATVAFNRFNGEADYPDVTPRYIGNSYDTERGLVIDTSFAQGLDYNMTYPTLYKQFTVMWWWLIPTFKSVNIITLNRNSPLFLTLGGNTGNSPGGTIYADAQFLFGTAGGATASLQNENSGCCPFNAIPVVTGGVCSIDRSLMDTWVHFTAAVSNDYQYTELYMNGVSVFDCVGFGGFGAPIQPQWGGPIPMALLSGFSGKVFDFRVYAGKLSNTTIASMYSSSQALYVGPTSFPTISGTLILQVQYSTSLHTFAISPTETTYTVAFLGQFSSNFLVSDPIGQVSTPVISSLAQFSFPTPAGLTPWTIAINVLWTTAPTFTPWFYIPSLTPGVAQMMVLLTGGNTVCLYQDVSQVTTTDDTPVYGAQSCISAVSFPLRVWTLYSFTFSPTQAFLYINGALAGQFTTTAGLSQQAILFQVPTQYWMYTKDTLAGSPLNSGYIQTVSVYASIVT